MYTNIDEHGGDFRTILDSEFATSENVTVATGYTSLDIMAAYQGDFIRIAEAGGVSRLLLGMAFYEGLSQKKLDLANDLNNQLLEFNNSSGVYVTNGRRYHGKVYRFYDQHSSNLYVGSSNFSSSGTAGNIECTIPVNNSSQRDSLVAFLDELYSTTHSITIDRAKITVPGKKKIVRKALVDYWDALERYDPTTIDKSELPKFEYSLSRVAEKEKSNLNVYFGKGRWNRSTGIVTPRAWNEIELIANADLRADSNYPIGNFTAYTDDGYIIPMRTQGAYYKNIRSVKSLQILGIWLKGKLERSGALKKYEPVTLETLIEYGSDKLTFFKMEEGKFYMEL